MKKVNVIIVILAVTVSGGVGFFAGMKYQQIRRQSFFRQAGINQGTRNGQGQIMRGAFRPVQGEIIAIDEKSITVKLTDGSSKIIILSENTQINKTEKVSKEELKLGGKIAVFGLENSDGSITVQNIQLNPEFVKNLGQ